MVGFGGRPWRAWDRPIIPLFCLLRFDAHDGQHLLSSNDGLLGYEAELAEPMDMSLFSSVLPMSKVKWVMSGR